MAKFHYVNRKSTGLKLGQVIAKDLLKRIPPGSSYKVAQRDPCIDLDISAKALSDEGLEEVAKALIISIGYDGEHGKVVRLEELCLKNNELTARSLETLGKVIVLAADDLRDLDLSDNLITINTSRDAQAWENFLRSFSRCSVLRRIDFSGNALGAKAFEILARVYMTPKSEEKVSGEDGRTWQSEPSNGTSNGDSVAEMERKAGGLSLRSDPEIFVRDRASSSDPPHGGQRKALQDSLPNGKKKLFQSLDSANSEPDDATRSASLGLPSVPYLIFSNTSFNETCALYLSNVITCHGSPSQLRSHLPLPKPGHQLHHLEAYDKILECHGIIYYPNKDIGTAGTRVLELAELVREELSDRNSEEDVGDEPTLQDRLKITQQALEAHSDSSPHTKSARRRSIAAINTNTLDLAGKIAELNRARSRIQGDTLRDMGSESNDLWHRSLKMLSVARSILLKPRSQAVIDPKKSHHRHESCPSVVADPKHLTPLASTNPSIGPRTPQRPKAHTASHPLTMTPITPSPFKSPFAPPSSTAPLPSTEPFRHGSNVGGLGDPVWAYIIALATEAMGIVSSAQQVAIVGWGADRGTLHREMDTLGKAESAQTWKVLDGMGCLMYEP